MAVLSRVIQVTPLGFWCAPLLGLVSRAQGDARVLAAGIPRSNSGGTSQVLLGRGLKVAGECGSTGFQEIIHEEENR